MTQQRGGEGACSRSECIKTVLDGGVRSPYGVVAVSERAAAPFSGRRLVVVGGVFALVGAGVVLWAFVRYGRDTFTRSARDVEARARAYELATGLARCMNRTGRAELPPSAGPVPAKPSRAVSLDGEESAAAFAADAFSCAEFRPRGEIHVQIEWQRKDATHGTSIGRLDENGDGRVDFEAHSAVHCDVAPPERCVADLVVEVPPH